MIRAILTDIEGTTTSLRFVHKVLFPYARDHLAGFIRRNIADPEVARQLAAVREVAGAALELEEVIAQLIAWIDADRKVTPLKTLQGLLWRAGYENGAFTGHVYADAVRQLRSWHARGIALYVFSSGSVQAQQLLFAYSDAGDLRPLFSAYYDTHIGDKRDSGAYAAIAADIGMAPDEILFLSDIREELDAARAAGMQTAWLVRDADPDPGATHRQVRDFTELPITRD